MFKLMVKQIIAILRLIYFSLTGPMIQYFDFSRTKILDGIHKESKRFPSEKVTDLKKSWRNTPGHVFFSKSRRT